MKLSYIILLLLILPCLGFNAEKHEYYVSVTTIEYSEKQQALQIISQVFIDDFETLLRKRYDESITLKTKNEAEEVEVYMNRYLTDKLKIKVNGQDVAFTYIGKEYKDDIVYSYLEVANVSNINSIEVSNQLLFDAFSDQQNILRLKLLGKNKSFLLVPENDTCSLNFE